MPEQMIRRTAETIALSREVLDRMADWSRELYERSDATKKLLDVSYDSLDHASPAFRFRAFGLTVADLPPHKRPR
jgi:hypothetical protein